MKNISAGERQKSYEDLSFSELLKNFSGDKAYVDSQCVQGMSRKPNRTV